MAEVREAGGSAGDGRLSNAGSSATAVPRLLRDMAAWSWRLLLVAAAFYLVWRVLGQVSLLAIALLAALAFTALLEPVHHLLDRVLPRVLAALLSVVLLLAGIALLLMFVVSQGRAGLSSIVDQASSLVNQLADVANRSSSGQKLGVDQLQQDALNYLAAHRNTLALEAFSGARRIVEGLAGVVLGVFLLVYFLYDGAGIWQFLVRLVPAQRRVRVDIAGHQAWRRIGGFVRGTTLIAVFHGVFIGGVLLLLGTPLAVPLAVLIFLGSFIPIIGAFAFGGLALLVVLLTGGVGPGILFLVVLVTDSQIEAHLLQPFLVGRYVKLHPVAVAVSLTAGGLLAGIPGAIFAVPLVSAADGAFRALRTVPTSVRQRPKEPSDQVRPVVDG